jgi:uncharacterized coiled-coil protein SlyX
VTWLHDHNNIEDAAPDELEGKRWVGTIVGAILLAIVGSGSAFVWRAYNGSGFPTFALGGSAIAEPKSVGLAEFQAFQQQVVGQMQSNAQALAAQQAEVKRLSDQVAAVAAKFDALQSSISSARASIPAAAPISAKKPSKPKPVSRISTGGAPLPPPIELTH